MSGEETRAYTLQAISPQTFGKYTLIGKLGHGGMAEVLLAVMGGKGGFRKLTVIKRLHPHLEAEPGFVDMFLDEARLAAQLDHPNCVQTLEVGEASGQHFLSMEYCDGQGLERLLRSSAQSGFLLPVPVAVRIIADALEGLGYAHELAGFDGTPLGVVHRDVSPQNLFVTYTGVVKLLDFGIAKAETNVVETRTGVIKGKYAYIAPEQALAHPVDRRADLWSMAVVLWECLTSRRLFKSVNELATLQETLTGTIKRPSEHNPEIPPELDEIVMRGLTREVDHRYQSASEFRVALERWLGTQPSQPTRRTIATLMKERFAEVQTLHKEKLQACLAAVEVGPSSIQRLVDAEMTPSHGMSASAQFANMTPSSARKIAGGPTSVTPPPMQVVGAVPTAGQLTPPPEDRGRALGWKLVVVAAVALLAVAIAIALPNDPTAGIEGAPIGEPIAAGPGVGSAPVDGTQAAAAPSAQPDVAQPNVAQPNVAQPDIAQPDVAQPNVAQPGGTDTTGESVEDAPTIREPERTRSHHAKRRSPRSDPPDRTASTAGTSAPVVTPPEEAPPPASAQSTGFLSLVTSPWTTVILGGEELGTTPLVRQSLPVGRHVLRLVNDEAGISEQYAVEIRPGETTTRRLGLR